MKPILGLLFVLLFVITAAAVDPTAGQNVLTKRKSSGNGFEQESWTWGNGTILGRLSNGQIGPVSIGSGMTLSAQGILSVIGGGSGAISSVGLTVPAGLSVTGSPLTDNGTLAITTALSGVIKGTGTGFAAAVAGTDYLAPAGSGAALTGITAGQISGLGTLATQNGTISNYLTTSAAALTYQPLDDDLNSVAALATTSYGRGLLTLADQAALRAAVGTIGDIVGPAGATDNAIAVFDGTTGKLVKSSPASVLNGFVSAKGFQTLGGASTPGEVYLTYREDSEFGQSFLAGQVTDERAITLPDGSGYVALTQNATGLVPRILSGIGLPNNANGANGDWYWLRGSNPIVLYEKIAGEWSPEMSFVSSTAVGNAASANIGVSSGTVAAGDDSRFHSAVTLVGTPDYLTISGQAITRSLINLGTHVTGTLPIANGGTGTAGTLTGLVRGSASAMTAAELSGDATTSGSNVVTVSRINGTSLSTLATGLLKNTTGTGVPSIAVAGTDYLTPSGNGSSLTGITSGQISGLGTLATQSGTFSGTSSGTNTGDNATNSQYSGLVSNATHTGDATGATALTVVAINGTTLSTLGSGILKNTTGTGVPSIAVAGTDYLTPSGSGAALTGITAGQISGLGTLATQSGTFSGTSSGTNTGDQTTITGNAGTATALQTARNINGVAFDGTANITVAAALSTLTGGGNHKVLYLNGSGAIQELALGSSGQYLKSNGATSAPSFDTPAGGGGTGWTLISTTTITGSPATVEISLTGSYRHYELEFDGVYGSSNGSVLRFKTSDDGGATWDGAGSDYAWAVGQVTGYGPYNILGNPYVDIWSNFGNTVDGKVYGRLRITNAKDGAVPTIGEWYLHGQYNVGGSYIIVAGAYRRNAAQVDNAIQFYTTPGGFTGGKIRLFGWTD